MEPCIQDIFMPDRDDILFRYEMHHIQNETILLKDEEVNVLPANHLNGAADGVVRKHGRTLLREFNEQNLGGFAREVPGARGTAHPANKTQYTAHEHADPPIDELQLAGIEWRSHKVTAAIRGAAIEVNNRQEGSLISISDMSNPDS